jgi:hypothetical protein
MSYHHEGDMVTGCLKFLSKLKREHTAEAQAKQQVRSTWLALFDLCDVHFEHLIQYIE